MKQKEYRQQHRVLNTFISNEYTLYNGYLLREPTWTALLYISESKSHKSLSAPDTGPGMTFQSQPETLYNHFKYQS